MFQLADIMKSASPIDILIPLLSVGVIAFIYVEGVYLLFTTIMSL